MPRVKLTDAAVKRLPAPESGRIEYFDSLLPSFALRVSDKEHRSFVVFYRVGRKLRRYTLGSYPTLSLADARTKARHALDAVSKKRDPATEKAERRGGSPQDSLKSIGALFVQRYAKTHQRRSWRETERILKADIFPQFGHRPIGDIRKSDVLELLDSLAEKRQEKKRDKGRGRVRHGGPMAARNAFKVIRRLFRWATEDRGIIEMNPVAGLKSPAPKVQRDRVLTDDEIRALWTFWIANPTAYHDACRVMLLTAQRVQEVGRMCWSEIDDEWRWSIPAERYKTGLPHVVPLTKTVRNIIEGQKRFEKCDYIFSLGGKALRGWSKWKAEMDTGSGVTGWQYRDLRRTARTLMTRSGIDFFVAERVIGHAIGGVAAVYDRHSYLREKTRALENLATTIDRILSLHSAEVVEMKRWSDA